MRPRCGRAPPRRHTSQRASTTWRESALPSSPYCRCCRRLLLPVHRAIRLGRVRACRFSQVMQETDPTELRPVFTVDGVSYIYIQVRGAGAGALQCTPPGQSAVCGARVSCAYRWCVLVVVVVLVVDAAAAQQHLHRRPDAPQQQRDVDVRVPGAPRRHHARVLWAAGGARCQWIVASGRSGDGGRASGHGTLLQPLLQRRWR